MSRLHININGRECSGYVGQSVLEIATQHDIFIPTLCHDPRVAQTAACGMCVVEAEGNPKLLRACSSIATDGMILRTDTKRIRDTRRSVLELLLSDHRGDCRPPCVLACPAQTDCQGYVGLIANEEYDEAIKLIKDKIPLPGSIGRVCPHPCETACRRKLVEEPIAIASLKWFVADKDLEKAQPYHPALSPDTGKSVAVIGGGPGGLSMAYFLRGFGHGVTVYDAMPEMGGMLRYGIPEYRLPKDYLGKEIAQIEKQGVTMCNNIRIGRDTTLDSLRSRFDAVVIAIGAWQSTGLRCKGEDLEGVQGGIEFLADVALGNALYQGRNVAIVGGGNTAMDACRTAVRLGAKNVYNVYRRTKAEMPAEEIEILEAEQEGVIFKNLTNPIEVLGENGKVKAMRLQIMELGEPDTSGRRSPVPVEGKEEMLDVDMVIVAIGQKLNLHGFDDVALTKWNTIAVDESTFRTSMDGVFAIGDAINHGPDIAITAIGEAKKAATIIDRHLDGEQISYIAPYLVTRDMKANDFSHVAKEERIPMPHRTAEDRKRNFLEINFGYQNEQAITEAKRCLECGCHDYFECKLIDFANQYDVDPSFLCGDAHHMHHRDALDTHPTIHRNPDKCVVCGLCVRICSETVGATALGLVDRGFDTVIMPEMNQKLEDTDCISCGQCVHVCPTGALTETLAMTKQTPTVEHKTKTVCGFCGVGCHTELTSDGKLLLRALPTAADPQDALLCKNGRFGILDLQKQVRLNTPKLRQLDGSFSEVSQEQAMVFLAKKLQAIQSQYGKDAVALSISPHYTNEEAALIIAYAKQVLRLSCVYSLGLEQNGLSDVLLKDGSSATFDELIHTDLVMVVGGDLYASHAVAGMKVRRSVKNGAKLILLSDEDSLLSNVATQVCQLKDDFLKQLLKAILTSPSVNQTIEGYAEALSAVESVVVSEQASQVATAYLQAKKAIIVFSQASLSRLSMSLVGQIAKFSGKLHGPRNGVVAIKAAANAQGLADLSVCYGSELIQRVQNGEVKGLLLFGENPAQLDLSSITCLAVHTSTMTDATQSADLVLPAATFAEKNGSFTNSVGETSQLTQAVPSLVPHSVKEYVEALAKQVGQSRLRS